MKAKISGNNSFLRLVIVIKGSICMIIIKNMKTKKTKRFKLLIYK